MPSTPPSADTIRTTVDGPGEGPPFSRSLPWVLLIGGIIGLAAAFVLTIERFALEADAQYIPSCSLGPVLNCGSIMESPQASVFGFPNSLLGLIGFTAVAATGAAMLAGAHVARWYWVLLQVGVTAAVVFVHWLIVQSLYVIGSLCPYCMLVWAVTVPIFWYVTVCNVVHGTRIGTRPAASGATTHHLVPVTVWFLVVAGLVAARFWSYWTTLI